MRPAEDVPLSKKVCSVRGSFEMVSFGGGVVCATVGVAILTARMESSIIFSLLRELLDRFESLHCRCDGRHFFLSDSTAFGEMLKLPPSQYLHESFPCVLEKLPVNIHIWHMSPSLVHLILICATSHLANECKTSYLIIEHVDRSLSAQVVGYCSVH